MIASRETDFSNYSHEHISMELDRLKDILFIDTKLRIINNLYSALLLQLKIKPLTHYEANDIIITYLNIFNAFKDLCEAGISDQECERNKDIIIEIKKKNFLIKNIDWLFDMLQCYREIVNTLKIGNTKKPFFIKLKIAGNFKLIEIFDDFEKNSDNKQWFIFLKKDDSDDLINEFGVELQKDFFKKLIH